MNKGIPKVIIIAYLIILTALIIPPTKGNFNLENSTTGSKIPETQGVTEIIWAETIFLNNIFTVSSDEKLIINAGVTIIMGENGGLRIYGNLSSNGREGLPVTITKEVSIMNWSGRIEFEGSYSELTYTIFENGYADKYNPLIHIVESTVVFQNCIFRNNNAYYGIITIREHSYMLLENSEFYQNYNNIYDERTDTSMGIIDLSWGYGIEEGSDMMIRQNVFHSNSHYYALGEFYDFTTKGIYFYNNIVVNQKGGIYGNLPTHDYNLYYSLTDSPLLGDHDIVAQPIFLDEGNYDFRLDPSSPGYTQGLDGEKMGIEGKLNFAPFVPALINQTGINENTEVKLRASGVFDLDFDSINFIWYQINGPNALIEEYDEIVKITVTSIGLYTFGLDVIDSKLKQTTQVFTINVDNGSPHKIRKIYSDSSNDNSITFKW